MPISEASEVFSQLPLSNVLNHQILSTKRDWTEYGLESFAAVSLNLRVWHRSGLLIVRYQEGRCSTLILHEHKRLIKPQMHAFSFLGYCSLRMLDWWLGLQEGQADLSLIPILHEQWCRLLAVVAHTQAPAVESML